MKLGSKARKVLQVLVVAVASFGIAAGAAACGPAHPHHKKTTVNGY